MSVVNFFALCLIVGMLGALSSTVGKIAGDAEYCTTKLIQQ